MTAIRVELELADGQFVTRMLNAGESIDQFKKNVARGSKELRDMNDAGLSVITSMSRADTASKGFLSTLRDVSIITGMLSMGISKITSLQSSWIGSIVRVNAEFEKLNFQMRGMARSADPVKEAGQSVAWLREQALQMPFSLTAITDGFVRLNATGINPTKGALNALADGITAFGGGEEQIKRVLVGISQMSGKGVVQMEEMRQQVAEHMPRAMELMARSMGISMAQLVKDISTGRMESKPALEMFFAELERTFGGRAAQMMDTFNGQLQRTKTQLQMLATSNTIKMNFFDGALKDQLADLNGFLTSQRAQAYADQLGNAMATGVQWIRRAIDTLIEFKTEIGNVAIAAAWTFGGLAAIRGITALITGFKTLSLTMRTELASSFALASQRMYVWQVAANSGAAATARIGLAAKTAAAGLMGAMSFGAAFAPIIGMVGLAAYGAAQYFDIFGNKVKDAYEEIKRFGAASREEAKSTTDLLIKKLEAEVMRYEMLGEQLNAPGMYKEKIDKLKEEIEQVKKDAAGILSDAGDREDDKMLTEFNAALEKRLNLVRSSYDREQIATNLHYDAEAKTARDKGESVRKVEEKRRDALFAGQTKFYQDQIDLVAKSISEEEVLLKEAEGKEKVQTEKRLDSLRSRYVQFTDVLRQLKQTGSPLLANVEDPNAAYAKGEKALQSLKEKMAGVRAEIAGTSPELAKLQEMLAAKKFGDQDREEVAKLANEIRGATAALEAFEEIRSGQKKAQSDLKSIEDRLFDQEMDLLEKQQGKTLTEGERFIMRMNAGAYKGLGPASEIAKALEGVYGRLDIAGSKSNQLGDVWRNNTFGQPALNAVQGVNDKLRETAGILDLIGQGLGGISFDGFNMNGFAGLNGSNVGTALPANVSKDIADRMAQAMKILMDKGWSQVAASGIVGNLAGESSLNPNARNKGDGRDGSDSIGMAQWNSDRSRALQQFARQRGTQWNDFQTQIEFIDWELRNNANFGGGALRMAATPEAASEMFMRKYERPADWAIRESGPKRAAYAKTAYGTAGNNANIPAPVAPTPIQYDAEREAALRREIAVGIEASNAAQEKANILTEREKKLWAGKEGQARTDFLKEMKQKTDDLSKGLEVSGNNVEALQKKIRAGDLGPKDIEAEQYKKLFAAAKAVDDLYEASAKKKRAQGRVDNQQEEFIRKQEEMARRVAEANSRMFDPLEQKSTAAYRSLRQDMDEYVALAERAYGKDTEQYRQALALRESMLKQHRNMETSELAAKWAKENVDTKRSLMTESQQRQAALNDEIARIDAAVAAFQGTEEEKVRIVAMAEERKKALRQAAEAAASPMTGMLKQWGDLQNNLAQASTNWMNSMADGITGLIMGTGDLRSAIQGILKDIVNMGVKYLMSGLLRGAKGGTAGKGGGAKGKAGSVATKGKGKGVMHTGGIVGAADVHRAVSPGIFHGAQKFHTGGIIGGPKLARDEVPIIAQKGEGVFTAEQMSAMGGFQQNQAFQINAPITVNGSAGTPEQNTDLANKMAKTMEQSMKGMVADEIRKQTKPGNYMNQRAR